MKITILQRDIRWADPEANVQAADRAIDRCGESDLFLLPEMFTTGFCTEPEGIAEPAGSATLEWMKCKAARKNAAVAGSLAVRENGRYYNRFYFVFPDGRVQWYDKKHLFTYAGEDKHYTAGTERVVVTWKGIRILLLVCYDLRFPAWSRNRGDYDLILYVASWPESRIEAWKTLIRARSIENQCYTAAVNRVGTDPSCRYSGGSAVIDPYGRTIAACGEDEECEASAVIDLQELELFREKFPVLRDADPFEFAPSSERP